MLLAISAAAALAAAQHQLIAAKVTAGAQTTVVSGGKIVLTDVAGVRSIETGAPVTARTLFHIGSITKLFTAVAVMQLVEQGKVGLDDPLAKYMAWYPNASTITVRELLMHRSGIPNYLDAALADGAYLTPTTPQKIAADTSALSPLQAPGATYSYSNTNYVLLGLIVERVAGMPLHAYYARNIFTPAGMTETFAGYAPKGATEAVGYKLSGGTKPQDPGDPSWYYGCGDILSTSEDLARFDIALMNGTLMSKATFASMASVAKPTGDGTSYGLGTMTYPIGNLSVVGHHGGLPGFESNDEMVPADDFAIVTLGNDSEYPTFVAQNALLGQYYPADMALALTQGRAAKSAALRDLPSRTARFTSFLKALLGGQLESDQVDDAMRKALPPAALAAIAQQFAALGPFQRLDFIGQDGVASYKRYHYSAVFAKGTQPLTFVLDPDGKISGLGGS